MKKSIKKYEFLWNEDAHSRQDFTFSLPAKIENISQPKDDTKDSHERSIARQLHDLGDFTVPVSLGFQMINFDQSNTIRSIEPKISTSPFEINPEKKRKTKSTLSSLKQLSSQVKELINISSALTYKQIASSLVEKVFSQTFFQSEDEKRKENQNLKRRVYDSINVMIALGILEKDGRQIKKGKLYSVNSIPRKPNYPQQLQTKLTDQLQEITERLLEKRKIFKDLTSKQMKLEGLTKRNTVINQQEKLFYQQNKYFFPLIVVATKIDNTDQVIFQMNANAQELILKSNQPITIFGDLDILLKLKVNEQFQ